MVTAVLGYAQAKKSAERFLGAEAAMTLPGLVLSLFLMLLSPTCTLGQEPFRPPSVPLIVSDPYLSVWLSADHAYDTWPTHWTGQITAFFIMVRVDNTTYRLLGEDTFSSKCEGGNVTAGPAQQLSVEVRLQDQRKQEDKKNDKEDSYYSF